jgi:hypothetical protein
MTKQERLDQLNAKLQASQNRPGYEQRVKAIEAEIAATEAEADDETT